LSFESIQGLFEGGQKNRNRAAFQTFLYAKVFRAQEGMAGADIIPGVYLIRDIYNRDFDFRFRIGPPRKQIPVEGFSSYDTELTSYLQSLLSDLFNPEIPFRQTTEEENCRNCPYKGICNR
jgi:hypothetical protein